MSFYTALTGLNGSSADISATSNNIANVGTTGFKRSRVEFGDIFATSPLQNASSSIGSGTILKGIKQQFTQGNIAASLNALDLAISGQGFFALKPSLTSAQTVYTRNGSLNVNNDRYVVDSAGQYLLTYPVNTDGSVTAKDLDSAVPLQLPVTSGDPRATSDITLGVNVNAASDVVTDRPQFQDGYTFDPNDPETFSNSTSITIFDDLGNPTIATVYFIKTQAASADDPTNKYDTRLVINDTIIDPDLVSAVNDAGNQIFVDRFGQQTTTIPDDNYFIEGKGSPLYKLDDLQTLVPSQPAKISGESSSFDFGEEGDKLVEIVTDPLQFKATRDAGNAGSDVYWGKDFLLVNVDDSDQPVSIDINPGFYNAEQLAEEVERAINAAYGDDRKFQVEQNVDDTISIDFQRVGADGTVTQLPTPISVNLLGTAGTSYVSDLIGQENPKFSITSTSPDFTKEQLLAHSQVRINETLNAYARSTTDSLGVSALKFAKSTGEKMSVPLERNQIIELERRTLPKTIAASQSFKRSDVFGLRNGDYSKSTLVFSPGAGVSAPSISISKLATPSFVLGKVTVVNNVIYQGMGTYADVIGSIDSSKNGTSGNDLQINLDQSFENKDFSSDAVGSTSITGWTVLNQKIELGSTVLGGFASPTDGTYPTNNGSLGDASAATGTYTTQIIQENGDKAVQLRSSLNSSDGYAVTRGPAIISDSSVSVNAGDTISFDWKAEGGSDAFDVYGYLLNTATGDTIELINETGTSEGASTSWAKVSKNISTAGTYKFIFVSGSFDLSGGRALGAQLYVDKIDVTSNRTSMINEDVIGKITSLVSFDSLSLASGVNPSAANVEVTVTDLTGNLPNQTLLKTIEGAHRTNHYLSHTFVNKRPGLKVFDGATKAYGFQGTNLIEYSANNNSLRVYLEDASEFTVGETVSLSGNLGLNDQNSQIITGRDFKLVSVTQNDEGRSYIDLSTSGIPMSDSDFAIGYEAATDIFVLHKPSDTMEAFFEGSHPPYDGAKSEFRSGKIIIREVQGQRTSLYDNQDVVNEFAKNAISIGGELITWSGSVQGDDKTALGIDSIQISDDWVDEKNPLVKVGYDEVNQRLKFEVDRTVLGSGTESNFNSFSVYGSSTQSGTNNIGLTNADNASQVQIRGGEVLFGGSFVATGAEIQPNDKRYGIDVAYNSDLQNFTISSGTTGEAIAADGANNVETDQKRSNIQIGRHTISATTGARIEAAYDVDATIIGGGDNSLFGLGATKDDFLFTAGTGLSAEPARAIGASANEPLDTVFKLSSQNGDNIFNVSVNGISGIIKVPATSYVGTTLAEALQTRINQITDPITGDTIGGVTVSYSGESNSFTFSTGTTGSDSTIKVKGAARLGLDDVPLGVGSVPEIYNLVQATDVDGVALYVDANGEVVTNPPENMVEGYYPLYIDEGELTFDKTGKLVSPKNLVHYEKQEEGLSISLDIDFSTSTQLAQPFSVLTVDQDGFTSGRLDGIEIDSSGTIRANYTNGQNNPLGKIVVANFNNQNGLKQIGNATYTETAVSGAPQVGEAGAEGFGTVLSGSLERSNVDITEELVNLITAQRNFQASAKAIETTTGLTQTIINIRM
ncbi:flagellar hook-basal body complex protein [Alphaproteobacteria bacterium]|nr:flagellar hook-basal body complex protein [Alphaproteobacteria bacterium]